MVNFEHFWNDEFKSNFGKSTFVVGVAVGVFLKINVLRNRILYAFYIRK